GTGPGNRAQDETKTAGGGARGDSAGAARREGRKPGSPEGSHPGPPRERERRHRRAVDGHQLSGGRGPDAGDREEGAASRGVRRGRSRSGAETARLDARQREGGLDRRRRCRAPALPDRFETEDYWPVRFLGMLADEVRRMLLIRARLEETGGGSDAPQNFNAFKARMLPLLEEPVAPFGRSPFQNRQGQISPFLWFKAATRA